MSGPLKTIYDDAVSFLNRQEHNFSYIDGDESDQILTILMDSSCFKNNQMSRVKSLVEAVSGKVDEKLKTTKQKASDKINTLLDKMIRMDDFPKLPDEKQLTLKKPFHDLLKFIGDQTLIPVITDKARRFEETESLSLLSKMSTWRQSLAGADDFGESATQDNKNHRVSERKTTFIEFIRINQIQVEYEKTCLESEDDISQYLNSLRRSLNGKIKQGKRIQL